MGLSKVEVSAVLIATFGCFKQSALHGQHTKTARRVSGSSLPCLIGLGLHDGPFLIGAVCQLDCL